VGDLANSAVTKVTSLIVRRIWFIWNNAMDCGYFVGIWTIYLCSYG